MPRHRTLRATLDWSFDLLPEAERVILRRLAVFAGAFSLAAAAAVVASAELTPSDVVEGVANLVAKSLVVGEHGDTGVRYRPARHHAGLRAREARRERRARNKSPAAMPNITGICSSGPKPNGRSGPRPNGWPITGAGSITCARRLTGPFRRAAIVAIGVALTAAAVPLWMHLWLMAECRGQCRAGARRYPRPG